MYLYPSNKNEIQKLLVKLDLNGYKRLHKKYDDLWKDGCKNIKHSNLIKLELKTILLFLKADIKVNKPGLYKTLAFLLVCCNDEWLNGKEFEYNLYVNILCNICP